MLAGSFQPSTPPPASLQPVSSQPASLCPAPDSASNLRPGSMSNESITGQISCREKKVQSCNFSSHEALQRRNVDADNRRLWIDNPRRIPAPSISATSVTSSSPVALGILRSGLTYFSHSPVTCRAPRTLVTPSVPTCPRAFSV